MSDRAAGVSQFYLYDRSGHTRALLNASGTLLSRGAYSAWGSPYGGLSPSTPFAWCGRWGVYRDGETGLLRMGARYYAPALGRFLSRDPIGFAGGINLYGYCGGDPVNYSDPSGLQVGAPPTLPPGEVSPTIIRQIEGIVQVGKSVVSSAPSRVPAVAAAVVVAGVGWKVGTPVGHALADYLYPMEEPENAPQTQPAPQSARPHRIPKIDLKPNDSNQWRTYYHYTTWEPSSFVGGMWADSSATPLSGLSAVEASQGLGIPLPIYEYPVRINPRVTPVTDGGLVQPTLRYTGGLPQVFFPQGTPPGSVGPPRRVRPY